MKLTRFLQRLHNKPVTCELKNGTVIHGELASCDSSMNCHFNKVTMLLRGKNPSSAVAAPTLPEGAPGSKCQGKKNPHASANPAGPEATSVTTVSVLNSSTGAQATSAQGASDDKNLNQKESNMSTTVSLSTISIRGVNIRYFLLPDDLDLDKCLVAETELKLSKKAQMRLAERERMERMGKTGKGKGKKGKKGRF